MAPTAIATIVTLAVATHQQRKAQKEQKKANKARFAAEKEEQARRGKIAGIQQRRENFAKLREVLKAQGQVANQGGGEGLDTTATSAVQGGLAAPATQFAQGIGTQNQQGSINAKSLASQNASLAKATSATEAAAKFTANANTLFAVASITGGAAANRA